MLWRIREQVALEADVSPFIAVQACTVYCMTNIGPTLCIQPDNTHTIHGSAFMSDSFYNSQAFVIERGITASR